jgi:hypothetical protein
MEETKNETTMKKCSSCKIDFPLTDFKQKRDRTYNKQCNHCCAIKSKSRIKNKCIHNREKRRCLECEDGGWGLCEHNTQKIHCKICGGSQVCLHNINLSTCKLCNDPIEITIKNMIYGSKATDKKYERFDSTNFIDYLFVKNLIDKCENKCFYCQCELQYTIFRNDLATIERLNNNLGHIKGNCAISCKNCNTTNAGHK